MKQETTHTHRLTRVYSSCRESISIFCLVVFCAFIYSSCSTKTNTPLTRAWHSFTAHYNTLHNGQIAFKEGMESQQKGHADDYTQLLPIYISTTKATANIGKSNYETAITKCEKAIKLHSIKKKPTASGKSKASPKEKEFRARKEFNPYLHHAWMMMGQAQFQQGNFIEAASTFNYIIRMYSTQPEIYSVAKAWLARCYVALEWPYDAEDILNKMRRDSMSIEGARERDNTQAAFLIESERYEEAIPYLRNTIKYTRNKLQKARLNYLMGQLYHETGDNQMAYKYLGKVARSNPPYELEFNARIMQTEVMPKSKYKLMIKKLQRMARNQRNKDYLDRVYYAIGNIYLNVQDTTRCLYAWEKGVEESTKGGIAKAVLLLRLGQVYWQVEKYIEAQKAYQQCISILDKEHDEYKESERRSKILDELAPPLSDVKLQDSLQALAQMSEKDYLAAIDRVIDELKKKEKEEAKKAARNGETNNMGNGNTGANTQTINRPTPAAANMGSSKGAWYFYNPSTVQSGKQEFQRRWGNRKNEDNWRRSNKQAEKSSDFAEYNYDEDADSLQYGSVDNGIDEEEQAKKDSLANDPHHREYYLKQIPFTEEQLASSNVVLSDGLYKAGILEVEKLENFPLALKTLQRLLFEFPEYEKKDDIYYHLFLLMGRMGNTDEAERYRQLLIEEYPEGKTSILLANPNYEMIASKGKHIEDSIYSATYAAYLNDQYDEVNKNFKYSTENFPEGENRAKLLFVHAMSQLYTGHRTEFMDELKELIEKYPKDEITEMAQYIVKGLQNGRLISGDKYNSSDIWGRRSIGMGDEANAEADTLSEDRFSNYTFVLAYPTHSLDEDQLLFEMARYNFTSFMIRNFEIELMELEGISMMCVKGFLSYDEVHAYAQQLYSDKRMSKLLEGIKRLLISEKNLQMLGKQYSFDDYGIFFDKKLAPLNIPDNIHIDEQTDIPFIDPEEIVEGEDEEEIIDGDDEEDFPYGF